VDLEQPVVDLPKYASFTQIADFERCPLQYKFRHVLRIPVVGNMHISYGTSIHAALELFTKQWIQREEPPPLTDLIRLYEMSWIDEWYKDDAVRAQFFEKGKLALAELYQTWEKIPPRPLAAEEKFTCAFEGGILRGQIDRVDLFGDGLAITDYKTGTPKTSKTLKREDRAQLYLYQWAVEELWKRPVKRLTYFYLEDNSSVDFLGTAEDVARVKRELEETWTTIRSSTLPPKPNPVFCSMCSFANICEFRAT
jgi:DNA helicase-2/ATP-dependent DNA helicase PcrA